MECGYPAGKYQRSPFPASPMNMVPSGLRHVTRAFPYSIMAHSSAVCQCSSRKLPAVRRILTPARSLELGSTLTETLLVQPPSSTRLVVRSKEYHIGSMCPWSVGGGRFEFGFSSSRGLFSGPGLLEE